MTRITQGIRERFGIELNSDEAVKLIFNPNIRAHVFRQLQLMRLQLFVLIFFFVIILVQVDFDDPKSEWLFYFWLLFAATIAVFIVPLIRLFGLARTSYVLTDCNLFIVKDFFDSAVIVLPISDMEELEVIKLTKNVDHSVGTVKIFSGKTTLNEGSIDKIYEYVDSVDNPEELINRLRLSRRTGSL
ncbi:MAG: hypothetical protein EOO88_13685 [Pedobacter sp.]|nr:MAG: hypothetical protein EOO88_13685 [Pedobacter sp.]